MVNSASDMVTGFSGSKSNAFISAFYSWRTTSGVTPAQPTLLKPGKGAFDGSRWGDYSYTSLDPNDKLTFWTVQEYAETASEPPQSSWGTWIGEIAPDAPNP